MQHISVYHYDAFSNIPNKGNPAGIVFDGDGLSDEEMQLIAAKVGFNETSFPLPSAVADVQIRYFTPGHEIDLCGHATIATIYALVSKGIITKDAITIETKVGILNVRITKTTDEQIFITMEQKQPQFKKFEGSVEALAFSLGLLADEIDSELPILYGSTGVWTLVIPIKGLKSFENMRPNNKLFPDILTEVPYASIHPICTETYDSHVHMHGRHFSSPFSGTIEDPVTGTASGVMGAYFATYIRKSIDDCLNLVVEQGQEINRNGRVEITVTRNKTNYDIEVTGSAVFVKEFNILI